jgi:hypothetical protein
MGWEHAEGESLTMPQFEYTIVLQGIIEAEDEESADNKLFSILEEPFDMDFMIYR